MTRLFFGHDIAELPLTDGYARRFLTPFILEGSTPFVRNAACRIGVAEQDGALLPFTVSDYLPDNSYVCSPFNHYVTYAQEELRHLGNRALEVALAAVLRAMGRLLNPPQFDRVVMVNNWLLSTNLYPDCAPQALVAVAHTLAEQFPGHAILFRSLDAFRNRHLLTALQAAGGAAVFTRRIWYQEARSAAVQRSRDFRSDVRLLKRTPYQIIPCEEVPGDAEIARLVELYNLLYLQKYSRHNPQFTPRWVRHMLEQRLMRFTLLVRDGTIDGAYASFARNGVMAQPFLGYDTALPRETALYRILSALILQEAERTGNLCHASSGVGRFKQLRGGIGTEEYNAVFTRHLPRERQRAWRLIQWVTDKLAVPIIRRGGY